MYVVVVLVLDLYRFLLFSFYCHVVIKKLVHLSYLCCSLDTRLPEYQDSVHAAQHCAVYIYSFITFSRYVIFFNLLAPEIYI